MDFIEKLLLSSRFDTILVIIDLITKQAISIPAHNTIIFIDLTCLFVLYIFFKYSILSHVTSDYDLNFISNFFCSLGIVKVTGKGYSDIG